MGAGVRTVRIKRKIRGEDAGFDLEVVNKKELNVYCKCGKDSRVLLDDVASISFVINSVESVLRQLYKKRKVLTDTDKNSKKRSEN